MLYSSIVVSLVRGLMVILELTQIVLEMGVLLKNSIGEMQMGIGFGIMTYCSDIVVTMTDLSQETDTLGFSAQIR